MDKDDVIKLYNQYSRKYGTERQLQRQFILREIGINGCRNTLIGPSYSVIDADPNIDGNHNGLVVVSDHEGIYHRIPLEKKDGWIYFIMTESGQTFERIKP